MIHNKKEIRLYGPISDKIYVIASYSGPSVINTPDDIWTCVYNGKIETTTDKMLFGIFCRDIIHLNSKLKDKMPRSKNISLLLKEYEIVKKYCHENERSNYREAYDELKKYKERRDIS